MQTWYAQCSPWLTPRIVRLMYCCSNQCRPSSRRVHSRLVTLPKGLYQKALLPMYRTDCKLTASPSPAN